jgi:uncharacterized MAPEG superfamily protein
MDEIVAQLSAIPFFNLRLAGMPVEITMLVLAIILGLVQLSIAARVGNSQRGIKWNVGARDEPSPPVGAVAGRLERAFRNFMETFPFFAAAVLIGAVIDRHNWASTLGAQIYLWARVVYVPLYAFGVPGIRTLVWLIAGIGLILTIVALFLPGDVAVVAPATSS